MGMVEELKNKIICDHYVSSIFQDMFEKYALEYGSAHNIYDITS